MKSRNVSSFNQISEDLASSMASQLSSMTKSASNDLVGQGKTYLKEVQKIFSSLGLEKSSAKIENILSKMGQQKKHKAMMGLPSVGQLMEAGIKMEDFEKMEAGNLHSRAKINKALWDLGYSKDEILSGIGNKNFMRKEDAELFLNPTSSSSRILRMIQDPLGKGPGEIEEGDEVSIHSVASNDRHTAGLTSKKQLQNLMDHGTQFNLADDRVDLLETDINDADLEVLEEELRDELGFEDETD